MAVDVSIPWTGAIGGRASSSGAMLEAYGGGVARGGTRVCWRRARCGLPTKGPHQAAACRLWSPMYSCSRSWTHGVARTSPLGGRAPVVCRAVRMMVRQAMCTREEGRSLAAGLRRQAANHRERLWSRALVVRVTDKARHAPVRYETARRTPVNHGGPVESGGTTSKPEGVVTPGSVLERSASCQSGVRRTGGVSPLQARVRNLGTCRLDGKGDVRVEDP